MSKKFSLKNPHTQDLTLTIDVQIQAKLEELLQSKLNELDLGRASAVAIDPRNGEVRALVSVPSFDNNDFSGGIDAKSYAAYLENDDDPLFNRSIAGTYPSGSTIKPAVAVGALQEGIVTPQTSFLSTGGIQVGPWYFPDWQAGGHGPTNVRRSLAWSVNTYYYYIGGGHNDFDGLGLEKLVQYLKLFKFGSPLGIDLPGEQSGFIPTREWKKRELGESWYIGDTHNLSIGQGHLLVTPLQIANLTATIANGGTMYQPHLVKGLRDAKTGQETLFEPQIMEQQVADHAHVATVAAGMKDCVDYGSCRQLSLLRVSSAGKTGTAQWNANKDDHAWFTSFAPFERPEIVVTILIEEGEGGSSSAVPVAYEFYSWWQNYKNR